MYAGNYLDTLGGDRVKVYAHTQGDVLDASVSVPILDIYTHKKIDYEYQKDESASADAIAISSLRFTWGYINPEYYRSSEAMPPVVAVITPEPHNYKNDDFSDYRLLETFETNAGLYSYRPFVKIYSK